MFFSSADGSSQSSNKESNDFLQTKTQLITNGNGGVPNGTSITRRDPNWAFASPDGHRPTPFSTNNPNFFFKNDLDKMLAENLIERLRSILSNVDLKIPHTNEQHDDITLSKLQTNSDPNSLLDTSSFDNGEFKYLIFDDSLGRYYTIRLYAIHRTAISDLTLEDIVRLDPSNVRDVRIMTNPVTSMSPSEMISKHIFAIEIEVFFRHVEKNADSSSIYHFKRFRPNCSKKFLTDMWSSYNVVKTSSNHDDQYHQRHISQVIYLPPTFNQHINHLSNMIDVIQNMIQEMPPVEFFLDCTKETIDRPNNVYCLTIKNIPPIKYSFLEYFWKMFEHYLINYCFLQNMEAQCQITLEIRCTFEKRLEPVLRGMTSVASTATNNSKNRKRTHSEQQETDELTTTNNDSNAEKRQKFQQPYNKMAGSVTSIISNVFRKRNH